MISQNIKGAWRATKLIQYNLTIVFQKFLVYANGISTSKIDNTEANSNSFL